MDSKLQRLVTGRILFVLFFGFTIFGQSYAQSSSENIKILYAESFEMGMNGWFANNGVWEAGIPTSGPDSVITGEEVVGTILRGNYPDNANSQLISPPLRLRAPSDSSSLALRVLHWYSLSSQDVGTIEVSVNGGSWESLPTNVVAGISSDWETLVVPELNDYAGMDIRLGFNFTAEGSSSSSGWYIDLVEIIEIRNSSDSFETFEGSAIGWNTDGDQWEIGVPTSGPGAAYEGNNVVGTVLNGSYADGDTTSLVSPPIQVPPASANERLKLKFWHWFDFGDSDSGSLSISENGGDFLPMGATFQKESSVWTNFIIPDLTEYASPGSQVQIAFNLNTTNSGDNRAGWFIDNIETVKISRDSLIAATVLGGFDVVTLPFEGTSTNSEWYADNGIWELGTAPAESGFSEESTIAGTVMEGAYPNGAESRLVSPPIYLNTSSFSVELIHSFTLSDRDSALVQVQINDSTWLDTKSVFTGNSGTSTVFRINNVANELNDTPDLLDAVVRLGFLIKSQENGPTERGWYISDITLGDVQSPIEVTDIERELPVSIVLHQNYPNPFNPVTTLSFEIDQAGPVTLKIFDLLGREIDTLVESHLSSGPHSYTWDAKDAATGIYVYQLTTSAKVLNKRMMLLR